MDKSADLLPGTLDMLILKAVSLKPLHGYGVLVRIRQILSGMLPVLATKHVDLRASGTGRAVIGGGSVRLRQVLIAGEVALTVVLLAATGLLVRTLIGLQTIPPGFNPTGVIAAKVSLDDVRYHDPAAFQRLLTESLTAMREIPGVQSAAVGLTLPYERALLNAVTISGAKEAGQQVTTNQVYVTPGYFETLQFHSSLAERSLMRMPLVPSLSPSSTRHSHGSSSIRRIRSDGISTKMC
jgi:hypothetical protein